MKVLGSASHTIYANYLPDEILLDILDYIPASPSSQSTLAHFCLVSKQWYNVGIHRLCEAPNLVGKGYDLFVRTVCPSLNAHIKKSELAGLGMHSPLHPVSFPHIASRALEANS